MGVSLKYTNRHTVTSLFGNYESHVHLVTPGIWAFLIFYNTLVLLVAVSYFDTHQHARRFTTNYILRYSVTVKKKK